MSIADPLDASLRTPMTAAPPRAPREWSLARLLVTPCLLAATVGALVLYLHSRELDSIERRSLNVDVITARTWEHVQLTAISTALVLAIGIPVGVLVTRGAMRRIAPLALTIANIGQAVPSIGVLVLLAIVSGIGLGEAVAALVAYSVLPVLQNTIVGLQQVDRSIIDAGRGMGMRKRSVLWRIELPLASPVIMAGVRTALIISVGTATIATFIDAGGLGDLINNGLRLGRENTVVLTGATLTAVLALTLDWLIGIVERVIRPKGL